MEYTVQKKYDAGNGKEDCYGFIARLVDNPSEERIKDVEHYHAADTESYAGIRRYSALKIHREPFVVPHPVACRPLHDVAGYELDHRGDDYDGDKDQQRSDVYLSDTYLFSHQITEAKEKYDGPDTVYDAVRTYKYSSVGITPFIYDYFKKHFIYPSYD